MIDLIISPCGQLATLNSSGRGPRRGRAMSELSLIEMGALGINVGTGTIEYCGPAEGLRSADVVQSCPVLDAAHCVVTPGLVDCHTHLVWAGSRAEDFYRRSGGQSYQNIATGGGGILSTVEAVRGSGEAELFSLTSARLQEICLQGTTAVEVKSGYGLTLEDELKMLRVVRRLRDSQPALVVGTCMAAHAVPPEYRGRSAEYAAVAATIVREAALAGLAQFADVFIDPVAFSQAEAELIATAARETGLDLFVHADEFGDDGTAAWACQRGALAAGHLGGVGQAGIAALGQSETLAVLLPGAMFYTHHGHYAPARRIIEAGGAVALASDHNPGSSHIYGLPFIMTLAALEMGMSPAECLTACTYNAACVLGLADVCGSLAPGKRADICIFSADDYREIPVQIGGNIVRDVLCGGRITKRLGLPAH